ncbi:hypothetical protein, partial [Bacillus mycoides]|uniref:hypothetical protein n=1 Tax=Bacillus mycoides TaxID=1405 RepID=UPI001F45F080
EFTIIQKAIEAGEQLKNINIQALIASKETAEAALQEMNKNKEQLGILQQSLSKQDVKSQALQHGPNVVNATVASPLNVEVQGRTLVNLLGQTVIDPKKYYLFMPNKGTTKITAGGSSYDGFAKFTGQSAITYTIKQDYRGKVAGSTLENGHIIKRTSFAPGASTRLLSPSEFPIEPATSDYAILSTLDGTSLSLSNSTKLAVSQILVSFDVIRTLQDKFGIRIWQGKTALADKVAIAKQLIADYTVVLYARGSGPKGNKVYVQRWIPSTSTWFGSTISTENNPTKIQTGSSNVQEIDNNGFIHVITYADASDGARPSSVSVDLAAFELKTKIDSSMVMLEDALYEVNQETYNKINVAPEYSGAKLIDKFPYVEGIQHLNPVVVTEGENLIPGLSEWTHSANAKVVGTDILEILSTGAFQQSSVSIKVCPSTTYTYTVEKVEGTGAFIGINFIDINGKFISQINADNNTPSLTVTTPPNCRGLQLKLTGREPGNNTLVFSKPMCVIGDKPKPFMPRNPSYLYTNTVLAGMSGINDVLYKEDGQWKVLRKWERDVVLDGNISWSSVSLNQNKTGFKEMGAQSLNLSPSAIKGVPGGFWNIGILVEPSGRMSTNSNSSMDAGGVGSYYFSPQTNIYIRVPNTDSGFSEAYFPVSEEVKAYFNGWKVKTADANGKPTTWISIVDGKDAPTQTLAYVKDNKAPNYTPYKLTYQLATPKIEVVQVEGDLVVDELTQVTVDSGISVREKVNLKLDVYDKKYKANNLRLSGTLLKNKVDTVIKVYKNGVEEKRITITKDSLAFGEERISINEEDFDPSAEYTVTYAVLDKHLFTTNTTDVKVSYNQSVRSTVDELTVKQADTVTGLSILQTLVTDILARLKANSL